MQRLEVSGAVRSIYGSSGVKRLIHFSCRKIEAVSVTLFILRRIQRDSIVNRLTPNDPYMGRTEPPIYGSYRTANLQTLHFIYLFNKYRY